MSITFNNNYYDHAFILSSIVNSLTTWTMVTALTKLRLNACKPVHLEAMTHIPGHQLVVKPCFAFLLPAVFIAMFATYSPTAARVAWQRLIPLIHGNLLSRLKAIKLTTPRSQKIQTTSCSCKLPRRIQLVISCSQNFSPIPFILHIPQYTTVD